MFERPAVGWAGKARSKACGAGRVRAVHAPSVLRTRCAWRPSRARPHVSGERLHGGRDRPRSSRRSRSSSSTAALGVTNSARVVKDGEACQSRRARREGKRAGRRGRGGQATHPAASPARPSVPSESATACTLSKYLILNKRMRCPTVSERVHERTGRLLDLGGRRIAILRCLSTWMDPQEH